jgi:hypothetical protein
MNELVEISKGTNNDIILWTIVLLIGMVIVAIPIYKLAIKASNDRRACELKREKEKVSTEIKREDVLITVIKENTSAITELTGFIRLNSEQQTAQIKLISEREEKNSLVLNEIYNMLLEKEEKK